VSIFFTHLFHLLIKFKRAMDLTNKDVRKNVLSLCFYRFPQTEGFSGALRESIQDAQSLSTSPTRIVKLSMLKQVKNLALRQSFLHFKTHYSKPVVTLHAVCLPSNIIRKIQHVHAHI